MVVLNMLSGGVLALSSVFVSDCSKVVVPSLINILSDLIQELGLWK
jgi:hypothetical protein